MSFSKGRNWEGLGGPVHYETNASRTKYDDDPTLDSCCQRDMEEQRVGQALRTTLRKYDIVAERERRRRNTVLFNQSSGSVKGTEASTTISKDSGCRCSYDPNGDGGEYRALIDLRMERSLANLNDHHNGFNNSNTTERPDDDDFNDNRMEAFSEVENGTPLTKTENESDDDDEDDEYDYLLDDDELPSDTANSIKVLEDQRRSELEWDVFQNEVAKLHGYGIHRQIHPQRMLAVAGLLQSSRNEPPPYVVMHLVDADSVMSASLDLYLEELATRYHGTMFIRSSGRATILLNSTIVGTVLPMFHHTSTQTVDADLPALVAIRDGVAVNACLRLEGLSALSYNNNDCEIEPSVVRDWLDRCGVLYDRPPNMDSMCRIRPEEEALIDSCRRRPEFVTDEERYDCGKEGCIKSFAHQHVGEQNDKQDGLLISEAEILNDLK